MLCALSGIAANAPDEREGRRPSRLDAAASMTIYAAPPEFKFRANEACKLGLHVAAGDPGTRGSGNWATVETQDGPITVGRELIGKTYFCASMCESEKRPRL